MSRIQSKLSYLLEGSSLTSINGVVVTWVVAIDPPGVRFPLNASDNIPEFFNMLILSFSMRISLYMLI